MDIPTHDPRCGDVFVYEPEEAPSLDLRPALDRAMGAIDALQSALPPEQKRVVLIGEWHNRPAHLAFEQALIARLHRDAANDNRSIAVGLEVPHDMLWRDHPETCLPDRRAFKAARRVPAAACDRDGAKGLCVYLTKTELRTFAPQSHVARGAMLQRNGISVRFNDAAPTWAGQIDRFDPVNAAILDRVAPLRPSLIDRFLYAAFRLSPSPPPPSPEWMAQRNHVIAANAMAHFHDSGAHTYIQICGSAHLFDDYPTSLTSLFRKAGCGVVALRLRGPEGAFEEPSPPDAPGFTALELKAPTHAIPAGHALDYPPLAPALEIPYLRAVAEASGGEPWLPENFEAVAEAAHARVRDHLGVWIAEACALTRNRALKASAAPGLP